MAFFDEVYKKLFGRKSEKNPRILHEILNRTSTFDELYQQWLDQSWHTTRLAGIKTSYDLKKKGIEQSPVVHIMNNPYANGIAISYTNYFEKNEFSFMLEHLSEKLLKLDYKTANSDVIINDKGTYTETIEKKYLKPRIGIEPPIDQKFGNILIENVLVDDVPSYLRLSANIYSDRLYTAARPFDELVDFIFKPQ